VLLMFVLALRWLDEHPILSGMALGFGFNVKYLPIVVLPYLCLRRRWLVALAMVAGGVGFALLPAVQSGWQENLRHLSISFNGLLHMMGIDIGGTEAAAVGDVKTGFSLSITSAVARVAHRAKADALAPVVLGSIVGICMLVTIAFYLMNRLPLLRWPAATKQSSQPFRGLVVIEWAGLMMGAVAFSPQTNSRHLVLVMPATALLATMILVPRRGVLRWPPLLAFVVLLLGLSYPWGGSRTMLARDSRLWYRYGGQGWCVLIGYGILLWGGLRYVRALTEGAMRIRSFWFTQRDLGEDKPRGQGPASAQDRA
jgi:hypothetical protein